MKNQKGNTPIIILSCITAFALLGIAAFSSINANKSLARDAQRLSDINIIRAGLSLYSQNNNGFPITDSFIPLGGLSAKILCTPSRTHISNGISPREGFFSDVSVCNPGSIVLSDIPSNPAPPQEPYNYTSTPDGTDYKIIFILENNFGSIQKGTNCATSVGITKC